jgi:small subunit ribosomal protein S2
MLDLSNNNKNLEIIEEMGKAGLHFGHRVSFVHPKMKSYIFGVRNDIHIIDLQKTIEKLNEVVDFLKQSISEGKLIMVVCTKPPFKEVVESFAKELGFPYVTERWLGGTFTNFDNIRKRVDYYVSLLKKKEMGEFEKYTKKEKARIDLKIKKLSKKFDGIVNLQRLPDIVFVLDMKKDKLAINEAKKKGIKVVAIADTNVNPDVADYFIPANDDAISSVKYILDKIKGAIKK